MKTTEEYQEWEESYNGELMTLTRAEVVELMNLDVEFTLTNANYHTEAEGLSVLADLIQRVPADTPFGWFAWSVNDLGSIRQCVITG